jgi:hypothetical protein
MKILFHFAHPAHYHLFKNTVHDLISLNHEVIITYNEKDVLENLLINFDHKVNLYKLKTKKNIQSKLDLLLQFMGKNWELLKVLRKVKPDLILGTSIIISLNGKLLSIPNIIVNEDDFDIINKTAKLGYRFATSIICPDIVRTGKWDYKCIKYPGYHELAYLHPYNFTPNIEIVKNYLGNVDSYTILRLAKLTAHHDTGIRGISNELAAEILKELEKFSKVYITSERELPSNLENYRIKIDPNDIHHILAYAVLYIGDSQTMAAECGVLGIPFIRFNDFVDRISYLDELEKVYKLGFGIKPDQPYKVFEIIKEVFNTDSKIEWQKRKNLMLKDKINTVKLFSWIINNYPKSIYQIKYQNMIEQFL